MCEKNSCLKNEEKQVVNFVIGCACHGKSTFIKDYFDKNAFVFLDVLDFQTKCCNDTPQQGVHVQGVVRAYYELQNKIKEEIKNGNSLVIEHTLFKSKRRKEFTDMIRELAPDAEINVYVVTTAPELLQDFCKKRGIRYSVFEQQMYIKEFDAVTPQDGFDNIYLVNNSSAGRTLTKIQAKKMSNYLV